MKLIKKSKSIFLKKYFKIKIFQSLLLFFFIKNICYNITIYFKDCKIKLFLKLV